MLQKEEQGAVEVNWTPVLNAAGYFIRIFDGETGEPMLPDAYTLNTSARFDATTLTTDDLIVAAYATTFDTVADDPQLLPQFSLSDSIAVVGMSAEETGQLHATGFSAELSRSGLFVKP